MKFAARSITFAQQGTQLEKASTVPVNAPPMLSAKRIRFPALGAEHIFLDALIKSTVPAAALPVQTMHMLGAVWIVSRKPAKFATSLLTTA